MHPSAPSGSREAEEGRELEKVDLEQLNSVFSLRKPRDIVAGLSSGTKSVIKGILAGGISLIAAPAFGLLSDGFLGFVKGLGYGELFFRISFSDFDSKSACLLGTLSTPVYFTTRKLPQ